MANPAERQITKFLKSLMEIQRRYAHEMKNAKTNRLTEVKELVDKSVATEANSAD